jgi:hypothetical protein
MASLVLKMHANASIISAYRRIKDMIRGRIFAGILVISLLVVAAAAQKPKEPPPDYFPLRVGDSWKYRTTGSDGKQSEFTLKVLSTEKQGDGTDHFLVETFSGFQPIHDWYSKPAGWVLVHRVAYPKNEALKAEYQPTKRYLKNPLSVGASWEWKGKGMMGVEIDESNRVTASELVEVPAGRFQAMKVETTVIQGGTPVTKTYWYANWVGLVKSTIESPSFKSTGELLDYSFKKPVRK